MKQHYFTSLNSFQFVKRILSVVIFLFLSFHISAQVAGDFRSATNGSWNTSLSWERFTGIVWEASGVGANNPGQIPDSLHSVFIQSGHSISIDATSYCLDLTINSGANLTTSASTLNSYGIWTNNGSFSSGIGLVTFNGLDNIIAGSATTSFMM